MKIKFSLFLLIAALVATLLPVTAHASLQEWSQDMFGTWVHSVNKRVYQFNSDATYLVVNSSGDSNYFVERGYWKIVPPTEEESGGAMEYIAALVLKARSRTTEVRGKRVKRAVKEELRQVIAPFVADPKNDRPDDNVYRLGQAKITRLK